MLTITLAIFLPFLAAIFLLLFLRKFKLFHLGWFVFLVPATLFVLLFRQITNIANGNIINYTFNWIPSFDINFIAKLDGLSMIFGLLITGIGTLVVLYSIYYLSTEPAQSLLHFYIYLLLFMGSMLGVVLSDHLMLLYVFWELTSISSFLLIAYWYQRRGSRFGAKKALLITISGGFAMLVAFLMLYIVTGTFSISEIIAGMDQFKQHHLITPIIILLLLGAFTKSAQFPFHIWLPNAMEAPTPVSAYLHSATMVKAGIYIIARFTPVFGGEALWFWLISSVGLITLIWGAFIAIRQTDLKALLAYSTVSQLGLIVTLFGIASLSFHPAFDTQKVIYTQAGFAALFHLMNHSTFKGALFMVIGIIDYRIGTRDLRRLGGLISILPLSFTIALIGGFSMAGLPPFNGFLSKEMFFTSMLQLQYMDFFSIQSVATLFPIIAWIASIFTFIYCMTLVFKTFFGPYQEHPAAEAEEASFGMILPPTILAALVLLIFFYPNILADFVLKPALTSIYPHITEDLIGPVEVWHGINTELLMTIGIIILGTAGYIYIRYFKKVYVVFPPSLSFDRLYQFSIDTLDSLSGWITSVYMTGYLRYYLAYIFIFFIILLGGTFIYLDAFTFTTENDQPINLFVWMIAISMVIASLTVLFVSSRLTAILISGYIGFAIAMLFVVLKAPDLALTQIIIETVTTALFLLCFYFLPEWKEVKVKWTEKTMNWAISICVGTIFTLIALSINSGKLFPSIAKYFEDADTLAGGKNIVNTILGDFRAFDTMLEVVVLFIAGIGVYTMIKYTKEKEL